MPLCLSATFTLTSGPRVILATARASRRDCCQGSSVAALTGFLRVGGDCVNIFEYSGGGVIWRGRLPRARSRGEQRRGAGWTGAPLELHIRRSGGPRRRDAGSESASRVVSAGECTVATNSQAHGGLPRHDRTIREWLNKEESR